LLSLLFNPEDGGHMLRRNVDWLSTGYTELYRRWQNSCWNSYQRWSDNDWSNGTQFYGCDFPMSIKCPVCELTNLWPAAHPAPQLRHTLATAGLNCHDKAPHWETTIRADAQLGRYKIFSVRGNLTRGNLLGLSYTSMSLFYFFIFIYLLIWGHAVA
jgi:hypothetical protein